MPTTAEIGADTLAVQRASPFGPQADVERNSNIGRHALLIALASLVLLFVCASARLAKEPVWLLLGAAGLLFGALVMRKWPILFIIGLLFVGNFKSTPAQGISLSDPTMVLLLLAAGAIFVELLFIIGGASRWSLHDLFQHQWFGICGFIAFTAVFAASYLYTIAPSYGADKLSRFVVFQTVVFAAPLILIKRPAALRLLLRAFATLGLILAAKDILGFLHPTQAILSGDADPTHIGDGQLLGMTLLLFLYGRPFRKLPKLLVIAAVLLLGVAMVLCTARGPLVSLLLVLAVFSAVVKKASAAISYKVLLSGVVLLIVAITGAVTWIGQASATANKAFEKEAELIAFLNGSGDPGGTMQERLDFYHSAWEAFSRKPLLGWGVGGWVVYYYGYETLDYPHNIILEIAAEQGIIGLAALFSFLVAVGLAAWRIWKVRPQSSFVVPLFAYTVLVCMFSGDINTRALWFWSGTIFAISRMCSAPARARLSRKLRQRRRLRRMPRTTGAVTIGAA